MRSGGGFAAIRYAFKKSRKAGPLRMWRALKSKNACKTCALGMGGQKGGMVNETGRFPEVCKKSVQAMAADMQGRIEREFFEKYSLEELKQLSPRELEACGRIAEPMVAAPGDTHYRPISWEEAYARVAERLRHTDPKQAFFYFSGRSSNEAAFLLQLFARIWGTNNVNNCSYYCHQASGVGLSSVTGSGTATIVLEDLDHCDLVFLIGANPASNHPRLMRTLVDLRRRGGKVIVVNPIKEAGLVQFRVPSDLRSLLFGSQIADLYVQPHAGGDSAFLLGVAKELEEQGALDQGFLRESTLGWDEFRSYIRSLDWDTITASSGVAREMIAAAATAYAAAKNAVFSWAMGVTHHANGVENVQAIAALAMMRGMVGRPHCGLLPLRGHSNVQGIGSMGVVPNLKEAVLANIERHFGVELPKSEGMDTLACMEATAKGDVRLALCLGGNLYGSNPDAHFAQRALATIDTVVLLSTTLNTGHVSGRGKETLILPVLARDEEAQATTQESMFNYVRLSEGGPKRLIGPRSEVEVVSAIAGKTLPDTGPIDWKALSQHRRIRDAISHIVPGYEKIGAIDKTKEEFQIEGRTLHGKKFPTVTGKAQFHTVSLPPPPKALRLVTIRSEGQFNTVVYEEEDVYRGQDRRDIVMMNSNDIERLGLKPGHRATVKSATGEMRGLTVRELDIRAGNVAMYYPEANVLVSRIADPKSRTPSFKNTEVTVTPD